MKIKKVTIIGGNGTMGYNAGAIFASFGDATVYLVSRDIQKSNIAIDKAVKAVRAESIRNNMIACDYSNLEECVKNSDLIFEAVSENINIKKEIMQRIGLFASSDTIIGSGTSGLSINEIATSLPLNLRKNFYGMHFFNPPYNMPLLELIPNEFADENTSNNLKKYFEETLLRDVVFCKDTPAFIANRIGFYFLNLCAQYAEEYKKEGGISYIDSIMGTFTGRSMTPCETIDFVGLDVHKAIVDNIKVNTKDIYNDTFIIPNFLNELISLGKLGRKTSSGFYEIVLDEIGTKNKYVYDIEKGQKVLYKKCCIPFAERMKNHITNGDYELAFKSLMLDDSKEAKICKTLLKKYIEYSIYVANEVCSDITFIDDAMATGFNWCPPLALSNVLYGTSYRTKYDYRRYFKAVK